MTQPIVISLGNLAYSLENTIQAYQLNTNVPELVNTMLDTYSEPICDMDDRKERVINTVMNRFFLGDQAVDALSNRAYEIMESHAELGTKLYISQQTELNKINAQINTIDLKITMATQMLKRHLDEVVSLIDKVVVEDAKIPLVGTERVTAHQGPAIIFQ